MGRCRMCVDRGVVTRRCCVVSCSLSCPASRNSAVQLQVACWTNTCGGAVCLLCSGCTASLVTWIDQRSRSRERRQRLLRGRQWLERDLGWRLRLNGRGWATLLGLSVSRCNPRGELELLIEELQRVGLQLHPQKCKILSSHHDFEQIMLVFLNNL